MDSSSPQAPNFKILLEASDSIPTNEDNTNKFIGIQTPNRANLHITNAFLGLYRKAQLFEPLEESPKLPRSKFYRTMKHYQKTLYILLEQPSSSLLGSIFMGIMVTGIFFTVGEGIFRSPQDLLIPKLPFRIISAIVLFFFMLELLLKIFSANAFSEKLMRISLKPSYLIDFLAIVPLVLQVFVNQPRAVSIHADYKTVSLLKALSILKLLYYTKGLSVLTKGFYRSIRSFAFLMFVIIISNFFFATMVYYAEAMNPKSRISQGIPMALWWSIVTMTTTGYGDVLPITPLGKVIGSFVGIFGMIILALPVVIVGYHFQEIYNQMEEEKLVERLREKEFDEKSSLNRDHNENFFLKSRIDRIQRTNSEVTNLLNHSDGLYKDVSIDLKSLYQSIYKGLKTPKGTQGDNFRQRMVQLEIHGRSKKKVHVKQIFKRGFGTMRNNVLDGFGSLDVANAVDRTKATFISFLKRNTRENNNADPENIIFDTKETIGISNILIPKSSFLTQETGEIKKLQNSNNTVIGAEKSAVTAAQENKDCSGMKHDFEERRVGVKGYLYPTQLSENSTTSPINTSEIKLLNVSPIRKTNKRHFLYPSDNNEVSDLEKEVFPSPSGFKPKLLQMSQTCQFTGSSANVPRIRLDSSPIKILEPGSVVNFFENSENKAEVDLKSPHQNCFSILGFSPNNNEINLQHDLKAQNSSLNSYLQISSVQQMNSLDGNSISNPSTIYKT